MSERKRPAFQFYPGDWLRDVSLRRCSPVARALWIDLLCLMHDGEPYGYLRSGGADMSPAEIARATGFTPREVRLCLAELGRAGVYSRTEAGAVFSRRMVRDEHLREVRASSGKMGGNPNLVNQGADNLVNQNLKQKQTPAVCSLQFAEEGEPSVLSSKPAGSDLRPPLPVQETQTRAHKQELLCIQRLWEKYLASTGRNPKLVTLTNLRKNKGLARLAECLRKTGGDLDRAEALMELAIERLAASDWHMGRDQKTGGKRFCEWELHLFPNAEKLEFWLSDERESRAVGA